MNRATKHMSAQSMHKLIWMCLGVFTLFIITAPTAIFRVNQMDKFKDSYVKSLTDKWKAPTSTPLSLVQNVGYQKNR